MSYVTQYALAQDSVFLQRVQVAMDNVAVSIQGEAPATTNHTNRANYAKIVLANPAAYAPAFALAICSYDATLLSASLDATIQADVSACWTALAGTI